MGQANYSAFNKCKRLWVVGFLEKKHQSMIRGQNRWKKVWDGPLHREMAVADRLASFKNWLLLICSDSSEWIRRQWDGMFLMKCASEMPEARKEGRQGNTWPVTHLGVRRGTKARSNLPEVPTTMFTVVIRWVSNGNDFILAPKQLQASYPDVGQWEELVDFIDKNGGPQELYILTSMFKCILEQEELDEEYMGLHTHGQIINDPIYGQILYNCCLWHAFKSKLGHNVKIFLLEMMRATRKEIAKDMIRPT